MISKIGGIIYPVFCVVAVGVWTDSSGGVPFSCSPVRGNFMKSSVKKCPVYPSQRILTHGRLAAALLGLCVFTADSTAAVVERYNAAGTLTASGTDIATVQKEAGAAEGDVIVISGTATHNSGISQTLENFTIRSAEAGVKQTINAGNTRLYNINNGVHTYHFNF